MKTIQLIYCSLLALAISACQNTAEEPNTEQEENTTPNEEVVENETTNPCDHPKTVADLLACAQTIGTVDSNWVHLGSHFNGTQCVKAWNDADTVLTITYTDSITVWRVGQWKETPGNYSGHWFTNFSAKGSGYTKEETMDLFALNPCSDFDWTTCKCNGKKLPADSIIQFEDKVKIGGNERIRFGIVGKNQFGKGGPMQWHLMAPNDPPFRLLTQEHW